MKQGQSVLYSGFLGSVVKVCDGQLAGMCEIKVPGGLTCVAAEALIPVKVDPAELIPGKWYAMCIAQSNSKVFPLGAQLGKYEGTGRWTDEDGEEIESLYDCDLMCKISPMAADCYVEQV